MVGWRERVAQVYADTEKLALDPPGGIPEGWQFVELYVYGEYDPDTGYQWMASAEYRRATKQTGNRRLIGSGSSPERALRALARRLGHPLSQRLDEGKGGWDTNWVSGEVND